MRYALLCTVAAFALTANSGATFAQSGGKEPSKRGEQSESGGNAGGSGQKMKSSEKSPQGERGGGDADRSKDRSSSAGKEDKDKSKGSADRGDRDKDKSKGSADRGDKDGNKSRESRSEERGEKGDKGDRKGGRNNESITVKVGATLPEGRSLSPVSKTIIEKYPEYRNYKMVMVEDRIVIVDPSSRKIVRTVSQSEGMRAKDCR